MQNEYDALGRIIKEARIATELTRDELAERIHKSSRYLAALENEGKKPSYETLCAIIVALNIDSNKIFYPNLSIVDDKKEHIIRMLNKCNDYELNIISSTLKAILDKQQ